MFMNTLFKIFLSFIPLQALGLRRSADYSASISVALGCHGVEVDPGWQVSPPPVLAHSPPSSMGRDVKDKSGEKKKIVG